MLELVLVMLGGAVGVAARHLVGRICADLWIEHFPWHTMLINILGSLLLGWLLVWVGMHPDRGHWKLILGTGFCGGFTTFSTFSVETVKLFQEQKPLAAVIYILATLLAALFGAWIGSRP